MASPETRSGWTVQQYLTMERQADERHEYLDGEVHAMAGESSAHGDISANLVVILGSQLWGKPCRVRTKDTKIRSGSALVTAQSRRGLFSYPDVVVICDEPAYLDDKTDVVLNPTVILEVLSPATETFDRGDKFHLYQTSTPMLRDYLLVAQDQPQVEHYTRKDDGTWSYLRVVGLDAEVVLPSIECKLLLEQVYTRVGFPEVPPE